MVQVLETAANWTDAVRRRADVLAWGGLTLAILASLSYWPGLMIWDSGRQYDQALSGDFDDWHPPAMEAVWRLWSFLWKGPAPMLLTQIGLYGAGFALMIRQALQSGARLRAVALALCMLMPLSMALMGEVIKDSLMAAALVCATGLWLGAPAEGGRWRRLAAVVLVSATAALRYNAFLAGAPLLFAMAPARWRDRPLKIAGLALALCVALLLVMPTVNRLLNAKKSGVELSLVIFDLGGIGRFSGQNVFPPVGVPHPVQVNRACYSPEKWDTYAMWVDEPCQISFDAVRAYFDRTRQSSKGWWIKAILAHPFAYAEHRLAHWNINTAFLVHTEAGRAVAGQSDPNAWNFRVPETPVVRGLTAAALASSHTPLGWPACWLALAFALAVLSPKLPNGGQVATLSLSALLYGLGYAAFGVATDGRYYLWTTMAVAVALVLALTGGVDLRSLDRRRLMIAAAPLAVILPLSVLWRLI